VLQLLEFMAMAFETDVEAVMREQEALIPASSEIRGRGVRASSLLFAPVLLVAGAGAVWWRGNQRISTGGVIGRSEGSQCSHDGSNCHHTKCCLKEGNKCYKKNEHWASCNESCTHNRRWVNGAWTHTGSERVWDCEVLSEAAASPCTGDGESCESSKCCAKAGSKCYRKNAHWASCNETCNKNFKWEGDAWVDKGEQIWDCTVLSEEAESSCTADGQDCTSSKCCAKEGSTCYRKNEHWASCNQTCNHNYMWENGAWADKGKHIWDCTVLSAEKPPESQCSQDGENCASSKCCLKEGNLCYKKNDKWSSCNESCTNNRRWVNSAWVDTGSEHVWDCTVLSAGTTAANESAGNETTNESAQNETAKEGAGNETAKESAENETANSSAQSEAAKESAGNETAKASAENETAGEIAENETANESAGNETAKGSAEDETAKESSANETANEGAGDETAKGSAEDETANESAGNETAKGSAGNETAKDSSANETANESAQSETGNESAHQPPDSQ